jgi:hypothetical protein
MLLAPGDAGVPRRRIGAIASDDERACQTTFGRRPLETNAVPVSEAYETPPACLTADARAAVRSQGDVRGRGDASEMFPNGPGLQANGCGPWRC